MPKIKYIDKKFNTASLTIIEMANEIIESFLERGFDLTLRQLYYQFIAQDLFPESWRDKNPPFSKNIGGNYHKLGTIVNLARLAGMMDWSAITDRTRETKQNSHWENPAEIISACGNQFEIDKWAGQPVRPEVWIEKEALIGVIKGTCSELDITHFSCRGYNSQSNMWRAGRRMMEYINQDQKVVVLHLGDHDPSGIDMTRDIQERLNMFVGFKEGIYPGVQVERLALNMDQIIQYSPPPSPAKITDSRAESYIQEYGHDSWELDALDPSVISELISGRVLELRDEERWQEMVALEDEYKGQLRSMAAESENL